MKRIPKLPKNGVKGWSSEDRDETIVFDNYNGLCGIMTKFEGYPVARARTFSEERSKELLRIEKELKHFKTLYENDGVTLESLASILMSPKEKK